MKCFCCEKEAVAFVVVNYKLFGTINNSAMPLKIKAYCKYHYEDI